MTGRLIQHALAVVGGLALLAGGAGLPAALTDPYPGHDFGATIGSMLAVPLFASLLLLGLVGVGAAISLARRAVGAWPASALSYLRSALWLLAASASTIVVITVAPTAASDAFFFLAVSMVLFLPPTGAVLLAIGFVKLMRAPRPEAAP